MEICGGQTHAIVKFGLDELLPKEIELVHGPGCPVCVTPLELIDKAVQIAQRPEVIFCSFGDMLRVPGSDVRSVRHQGARRRCADPLFAAGCAEDRQGKSDERRLCSSPWDLRPRLRRTPWLFTRRSSRGSRTSRCWCRMCWCRRRWRRFWARRPTACRAFWPQGTSAPSWATTSTFRSRPSTRFPSW